MSSSTHQEMLYMGTNKGDEILEPMRSLRGGLNGDEVSSTTIDLSCIAPFLQIAFAILAISFATRCLVIQLNRFVGHWTFERSEGYLSDMWRIRNLILEREREEERSKEPKEERTKRLQEHFKATNVITTVKEHNLIKVEPSEEKTPTPDSTDESEDLYIDDENLLELTHDGATKQYPALCAICLSPYVENDNVVHSSNLDCSHCFHEKCIISWLVHMQKGTPCPCCRHEFTNFPSFNVSDKEAQTNSETSSEDSVENI